MPNWCSTTIKFHGNKKEIEDFHKNLNSFMKQNYMENGFGYCWLGNILCGVGLGDRIDAKDNTTIRCRGWVSYLGDIEYTDDEDATFVLDMDSAWTPAIKMWTETIKTLKYESVKFSYIAEEMGLGLYAIYDPFDDWPDRYCIDGFIAGEDENNKELINLRINVPYTTEGQIVKALQNFLKTEETDYEKLVRQIESYKFKDEETYINVIKFELLDSPDWEF